MTFAELNKFLNEIHYKNMTPAEATEYLWPKINEAMKAEWNAAMDKAYKIVKERCYDLAVSFVLQKLKEAKHAD